MQKKRYVVLDALRGFAILGIILANFPEFSLWTFSDPATWTRTDIVTRAFQTFFVDGKFYTLFSLLFGIGFSIQIANAGGKLRTFYRRMVVLLLIGLIHLFFLWSGDILALYAVCGMILPWGRVAHDLLYLLSVYPMGFAYAAGFGLVFSRSEKAPGWMLLAYPGRMACTNYLGQSVFGILLFYGISLGFGNRVGLLGTELIALGVYAFQILFSTLWMRPFTYGPVEWVWRMLSYGKRLPLKRQ